MLASTAILRRAVPAALLALGLTVGIPSMAAPTDKTNSYQPHTLVSNGGVPADHTDTHLRNSWGVAFNPAGFVWVTNNHDGTSTLYDGKGVPSPATPNPPGPLVVTIPPASGSGAGSPTGIVFNWTNDFEVTDGTKKGIAKFIFASEDGVISGWAPDVDRTHAQIAATADDGAVYTGIAIAGNGADHFRLYAADFLGKKIDVYDEKFHKISVSGGFVDTKLPKDFSPFNIQNIQGNLYVAYAKKEPDGDEEIQGPGLGFVDVFNADGVLLLRFAKHGSLNAPWGLALAPSGFGRFSNDVLVGNLGDGTISAFNPEDGHFEGQLKGPDGKPLKIDGLWGIAFGNGILDQQVDTLFFAAGPNGEEDGAYGRVDFVPSAKGKGGGPGDD
jgi:uncharacterized protein (TIGR03118 family)